MLFSTFVGFFVSRQKHLGTSDFHHSSWGKDNIQLPVPLSVSGAATSVRISDVEKALCGVKKATCQTTNAFEEMYGEITYDNQHDISTTTN